MTLFKFAMWQLINWASDVYTAKATADTPFNAQAGARFARLPIYTDQTIFEDESRLIHKLLTYWIYYVRHCSPSRKADGDRQHEDVTHQDYGQQGHRTPRKNCDSAICTHAHMLIRHLVLHLRC